ncbi:Polynucleotide 5'-hydroxyl-kinase grc3 [Rhynchospora pubera]|uniref:Polynucleotide 5'-hydroxyl-kinase grc3 n=1 Tax=Rhynchospora pubera TaxID=906938 RepID=A0AAV8DDE2_9POAL|nr:Polynucleotide 5'-hydroxyl-kinase grc3 [Rhynchospora pubera]
MVAHKGGGACASPSSQNNEIAIPIQWPEAAEAISRAAASRPGLVVAICGPKNSGKSTFSRFLLNTLLQRYRRVAYLDTDVGQPEFSPPGSMSLHIVDEVIEDLSNSSVRAPERSFFFGDISSKRDPEAYLNCVYNLYDHFVTHFRKNGSEDNRGSVLPLIINTPGWVKGTGFDILVEIMRYVSPSVVVQLRISLQRKNLPTGAFWLEGEEPTGLLDLIDIESAQQDLLHRSVLVKKDARFFRGSLISEYFRQCFTSDISISTNKELAFALASIPPYQVPFSRVTVKHLHHKVPADEILHSLNATIVGLAVSSDRPTRANSYPWCIGLGIIRGIDVSRGLLYVITPVPIQSLQKVDILLQGLIEIPTRLLQVHGCVSPYMCTNVVHTISHKDLLES